MDLSLLHPHTVLDRVDGRLLSPENDVRIWPTRFPLLHGDGPAPRGAGPGRRTT